MGVTDISTSGKLIDCYKFISSSFVFLVVFNLTSLRHYQGKYTLEIFDMAGNGLSPGRSGSNKRGSWKLTAVYGENNKMELASGGANFLSTFVEDFVVETIAMADAINNVESTETQSLSVTMGEKMNDEPSKECLQRKMIEELSLGRSSGTVCECQLNQFSEWELYCYDQNSGNQCALNRGACGNAISSTPLKCCGDRRCSNGTCRSVSQGRGQGKKPLMVGRTRLRGAQSDTGALP